MLALVPTCRPTAEAVLTAAWVQHGVASGGADDATAPRYRNPMADGGAATAAMLRPSGHSLLQAALDEEASRPSAPVYRSGQGPLGAPPELLRQPPFRHGGEEQPIVKLLRAASEKFTRLPEETGCVLS